MNRLTMACAAAAMLGVCGCQVRDGQYYTGYTVKIDEAPLGGTWKRVSFVPKDGTTTFQLEGYLYRQPTSFEQAKEGLLLTVRNEEIVAGRSWRMDELDACAYGTGYHLGPGPVRSGTVTVEKIDKKGRVFLVVDSPELSDPLQGRWKACPKTLTAPGETVYAEQSLAPATSPAEDSGRPEYRGFTCRMNIPSLETPESQPDREEPSTRRSTKDDLEIPVTQPVTK